MVVDFRFSPPAPSCHIRPTFRAAKSRVKPLQLNILPVSTFTSKILRAFRQPRPNKLKDLAPRTGGATTKTARFQRLSPTLSRFYQQPLWIQDFTSVSGQPHDSKRSQGVRGIPDITHRLTGLKSGKATTGDRGRRLKQEVRREVHGEGSSSLFGATSVT
jgi:hypothetical protein